MANQITMREYNEIKNETVQLIRFENGRRKMTIGGMSYKNAIDEMQKSYFVSDCTFLIAPEGTPSRITCLWDEKELKVALKEWWVGWWQQ